MSLGGIALVRNALSAHHIPATMEPSRLGTALAVPDAVPDDWLLPIARPEEVLAFVRRLPMTLDETAFAELVLGFPRRYLETTPGAKVLRHYALMRGLGESAGYRLCVVARDRRFLFARIAGSLSCFGLDILSAEAFANANAMVLDTFTCSDPSGRSG